MDAFRNETAQAFDREDNSVINGKSEEYSVTALTETFTAALTTNMSSASSLDNNSLGDVFGAEVTSEYHPVSDGRGSDNAEHVQITTGFGPPADENEQTSLADFGGNVSTGAPTRLDEFFETISSTAQVTLSSEQFSATSFFGDTVVSNISEGPVAQDETNGGSNVDRSVPVASSRTAASDDRQGPLYSLHDYSTSHGSYSADFKNHDSPNQTDIPALVVTSDTTEDVERHSHVITAVSGNSEGNTTDYEATLQYGKSVGTASDSNATQLQQDHKSTNTGQDAAHYNDTGGLNRSLTTQESVSEGETKLSSRTEATTRTGTDHNTTANVPLTSVVSVGQQGSVMSETYVFNFTEFATHASSKGNLENASEFRTHYDKMTIMASSHSSYFVPTRISEITSTKRSSFTMAQPTAQPTSPDSEYDDTAPSETLSSSSVITKLIYDKTPFATETDDDAEDETAAETVSGAGSDEAVRQDNYGEPDATDAEEYDDTKIPEVSPTSQRVSTPETTTSAHSTDMEEDVDANEGDGGVREVRQALRRSGMSPNTERPRIQKRNKLRKTYSKVTSEDATRLGAKIKPASRYRHAASREARKAYATKVRGHHSLAAKKSLTVNYPRVVHVRL
ncbi:hypothetical protein MTO96_010714 [Rhipicephalus appendiculatus]